MRINDINLDDFDKKEYLAFVQALLDYFYVQFNEAYILKKIEE